MERIEIRLRCLEAAARQTVDFRDAQVRMQKYFEMVTEDGMDAKPEKPETKSDKNKAGNAKTS